MERKYWPVSEDIARTAKHMSSYFDYKEGSATSDYKQMCDEA